MSNNPDYKIDLITIGLSAMTNDNVEVVHNQKFNRWLYQSSHDTIRETDENENVTKVWFSRKTKDGFDLTEKQFIEYQLDRLSKLPYSLLKVDEKAKVNYYKDFLENRKPPEFKRDYIDKKKGKPFIYVIIGSFFAQNLIYKKNQSYYFRDKPYSTFPEMLNGIVKDEYLKDCDPKTIKTVVTSTYNETQSKSIFSSETQLQRTVDYCKDNKIEISGEKFLEAMSEFGID